jgi:FKBP-type peptidyl-prolyl cis-trans isomerase FkpA
MKQTIFTLFLLSAISLTSCRKNGTQPDIKQYDDTQIQNYIKANGITGMTKANDTTGVYYKIILPGSGKALDFPDRISFVFSLKSFDGKYTSVDTINNHMEDYVGHITNDKLPLGLELAIVNVLKYRGASMRLLIPSHLAYGVGGYGTGSSQNVNTKIAGNQCLDYYVHIIGDQVAYDETVIQNYLKANNLTGYTRVKSILDTTATPTYYYYQILTPGTGQVDPITENSTITANYTGLLFNGYVFDGGYNGTTIATDNITDVVPDALVEAFENYVPAGAGTKISVIMPSRLGYGEGAQTGIPANSCLRFTWVILSVTP